MNNTITVNDVMAMCQIINLAASRGAFRGDELTEVGAIYDRLSSMLESVQTATQIDASHTTPSGE